MFKYTKDALRITAPRLTRFVGKGLRKMSSRGSSRRPPAHPKQAPARRKYSEQVESAEVRRSRRAAILQLRLGRLAHVIGIASGLALALTALFSYGVVNWDFFSGLTNLVELFKWFIPLATGIIVAAIVLWIKWDPYVADRAEPHFVMTVAALVVPAFLAFLIILDEYNYVNIGAPNWLYPASLLGICLTEISLAMTWEGTSTRRTISILAAIFPPILLSFPVLFEFQPEELARILPMAYLGSAIAIQLSGSMLHIISSSTSVQQREVLRASDGKLKEQLLEIDRKREALAYKEYALRSRESELEAYEKKLADEMSLIEDHKKSVISSETEIDQRLQTVRGERERLSNLESSMEDEREAVKMKLAEVEVQRRELDKRAKEVVTKEQAIFAKEKEASRFILEAQARDREIKNRVAEVQAEEAAIELKRKEIDNLKAALAAKERQISARESSLDVKSLEAGAAREQLGKVAAEKSMIKTLEQQLLQRQQAVSDKEMALRTAEEEIKKKAERADRLIARADKQMNELVDKESSILARENALADKESLLKGHLQEFDSQMEDVQRVKVTLSDKEKQYQDLLTSTRGKLGVITSKEEEIARKMVALEKREEKIKELDGRLKAEQESMNKKLRELLEKEKAIEAEEEEIGLRHAELKAMERDVLESVENVEEFRAEVPVDDEREKVMDVREKHLLEKEQEMKSRLYLREKELEKREQALSAHLKKDIEGMEESVEEEYVEEKVRTGVERIDDLLMGGMPFGSNVLYVGPPFIGKEIGMLLFIEEGLKKGVPAIIITTSKPPAEIAKDMAPILPAFVEFEHVGLVHWIDATGTPIDTDAGVQTKTNVIRVTGPGDFNGILAGVEKCVKTFEKQKHPYCRLAYFSLSMSIAQAQDKAAFQFVQTLAGRMKLSRSVCVYAIERGMHTEQQQESIQHLMTGAIQFKTEKTKTLLSIQGIGDVQTRDWVDYRHTNKALIVGAFSLERIR